MCWGVSCVVRVVLDYFSFRIVSCCGIFRLVAKGSLHSSVAKFFVACCVLQFVLLFDVHIFCVIMCGFSVCVCVLAVVFM